MLQRTNSKLLSPTSRTTGHSIRAMTPPASAGSATMPLPSKASLPSSHVGRRENENVSDISDGDYLDDGVSSDSDHLEVVEPAASWTSMARRATNTDSYPLDLEIADLAIPIVQETNSSDCDDDRAESSPLAMERRTPAKILSMGNASFKEKPPSCSSFRSPGSTSAQNLRGGRHPSFQSQPSNPRDASPVHHATHPQTPSVSALAAAAASGSVQSPSPRPLASGRPPSIGSLSNEPPRPPSLAGSSAPPCQQLESRGSSVSDLSVLSVDNSSPRSSFSSLASPGRALIPAAVLAAKQMLDQHRARRPSPHAWGANPPESGYSGIGLAGGWRGGDSGRGGGGIPSHLPYPLSEDELFDLTLVISAQEERYGLNMFDSMLPEDQPEMSRLQALGYRYEDAALLIFETRYKDPADPPTPLPLLQRTSPRYSSMVAPAMYPAAGLPMYYPPFSPMMPPPIPPQVGYPYSNYPMTPPMSMPVTMPMTMPMLAPRPLGRPGETPSPALASGPTHSPPTGLAGTYQTLSPKPPAEDMDASSMDLMSASRKPFS